MRTEITDILLEVGVDYQNKGVISDLEIIQGHDVHAFYRFKKRPNRVVHVQGYPGMSNSEKMYVSARLRDYNKMLEERIKGNVSIGNEHKANLPHQLVEMQVGMMMPYDSKILQEELEKGCELF